MAKTPETLNENLSTEKKQLDNLKKTIQKNGKTEKNETIEKRVIDKEIRGKMASDSEISIMKRCNIIWSDWKVGLLDLAKSILDYNYNNSGDKTSWKKLRKNEQYVARIQVVLNLHNKNCEITGRYDDATKRAAEDLIKRYKNDSSFHLASDGTVPSSAKNVIAEALLFPDWKGYSVSSKNDIKNQTLLALKSSSYDPNTWIIKVLKLSKKDYPEWTHGNTTVEYGSDNSYYDDEEW